MKEINKLTKGYAKMIVANVDNNDLKDEHFLMIVDGRVLANIIVEIKKTNNWANNIYKNYNIDTDNDIELYDCVANLIQDNIDKLIA